MFTPAGFFKTIACPARDQCHAVNCVFSHDPVLLARNEARVASVLPSTPSVDKQSTPEEPATKRRRIDVEQTSRPTTRLRPVGNARVDAIRDELKQAKADPKAAITHRSPGVPESLLKAITPPPVTTPRNTASVAPKQTKQAAGETLNPRLLSSPPAGHEKRLLYLRHIHDQMTRLNTMLASSKLEDKTTKSLGKQDLVKLALDEEELLARENPVVYANVIKQRIAYFKKLDLKGWLVYLDSKQSAPEPASPISPEAKQIKTGLTSDQELVLLESQMLTSEATLAKLGFVLEPPSDEAIHDAERMVQQASNWEVCDRCKTRFQVFPDRRAEDGVLTTNGPCVHHWGKLRRPKRAKTDAITGSKESVYSCCGDPMNSPGCVTADSHVYKMSEPARLASVVRFEHRRNVSIPGGTTSASIQRAITFDCEMGYTVCGLEMIRLTAVSWPASELLVDVLVQPKGTVLDFNSRFSGVTADMFKAAGRLEGGSVPIPAKQADCGSGAAPLGLVGSPEAARKIMCSLMDARTILIGHALDNDMNVLRLCHDRVVDTVALFPHPAGLPIRHGLKGLSLAHLQRDIQTGGEAGHDSLEDAVATGDLVRAKMAGRWQEMQAKGWRFVGGDLVQP